eukprot:gene17876-24267_t
MSMSLEMPFKDCEELPDPIHGYTPERASRLGAAMLTAVNEIVPQAEVEDTKRDLAGLPHVDLDVMNESRSPAGRLGGLG